jgi:hypothetical protein
MSPADDLDLIPDPGEIRRRIEATANTQKLLRRLLKLSLSVAAQREKQTGTPTSKTAANSRRPEAAHVG